jgi:hypothetical protein
VARPGRQRASRRPARGTIDHCARVYPLTGNGTVSVRLPLGYSAGRSGLAGDIAHQLGTTRRWPTRSSGP